MHYPAPPRCVAGPKLLRLQRPNLRQCPFRLCRPARSAASSLHGETTPGAVQFQGEEASAAHQPAAAPPDSHVGHTDEVASAESRVQAVASQPSDLRSSAQPSDNTPTTPSSTPHSQPNYNQPPYASAMHFQYRWPRSRNARDRPAFLKAYPVPQGCLYNVNSFLGKKEVHGGKYLVPQQLYGRFLHQYLEALEGGYSLFCTENYQQQVYRYFVELDWDWDTPLDLVMEVTPRLLDLMQRVASEFYQLPHARTPVVSIRTPYKVHINFPDLLTTELLANLCRDKILDACREQMPEYSGQVDWERLIDFPHGSLRLMGSRKSQVMDSDPAWVRDKAYHPARLVDGRWRPGRITATVLQAASIFPTPDRVAAFERSAAYLDMIYQDLAAYKQKLAERQQRRLERLAAAGRPPPEPSLPPGSSKQPLVVRLEVQPDDTVKLHVRVKSKYRTRGQQEYRGKGRRERRDGPGPGTEQAGSQVDGQVEAQAREQAEGRARDLEGRAGEQAEGQAREVEARARQQAEGHAQEVKGQGVEHTVEGARETAGVADEALSGAGGLEGKGGDGRLAEAVVEGSGKRGSEATALGKEGGEGPGGVEPTMSPVGPVQATA